MAGEGIVIPHTIQDVLCLEPKKDKERWMGLLRLAHEEYPFCTMYGVDIVDGAIMSCEKIQKSLLFGDRGQVPQELLPDLFDVKWQALETLCKNMGTGRLSELRFSAGRPVIARTTEGGRRFRHFLKSLNRKI